MSRLTPLALTAFSSLSKGMTLEDIRRRLGTPDHETEAGSAVLKYRLSDGSSVDILYASPQTLKCVHYRSDGTRMTWVPS